MSPPLCSSFLSWSTGTSIPLGAWFIISPRHETSLHLSVSSSTMGELMRPFTVLKRPWALIEAIRSKKRKYFARCRYGQLYTLETPTARICEEFFSLVCRLFPAVKAALHASAEDFLEDFRIVLFCLSCTV